MINVNDKILDQLDAQEFYLAMQIARHIGKSGTAWPGMSRLVKLTGWSKPTVLKVRQRLEDKNIVGVAKRKDDNGRDASPVYRLNTPLLGIFMGANSIDSGEGKEILPRGKEFSQTGVKEFYPEGKGDLPEVLTNRSINKVEERGASAPALVPFGLVEEDLAPTPSSAPPPSPDDVVRNDHPEDLPKWEQGSPEVFDSILSRIAESLKKNQDWSMMVSRARLKMSKEQFFDELKSWITHNQNSYQFYLHPVKRLRGGRSSFQSWLGNSFSRQKYGESASVKETAGAKVIRKGGPIRKTQYA